MAAMSGEGECALLADLRAEADEASDGAESNPATSLII